MDQKEFERKMDELGFLYEQSKGVIYNHFPVHEPDMKVILDNLMHMRDLAAQALWKAKKNIP